MKPTDNPKAAAIELAKLALQPLIWLGLFAWNFWWLALIWLAIDTWNRT